ncbi:MAG: Crp/Fnr family transcriptional regulator [Oscillospiraceae bacterium]|nr:Crp/Fnr family transcriptional regulator [Oscillospiraceae bacterium]
MIQLNCKQNSFPVSGAEVTAKDRKVVILLSNSAQPNDSFNLPDDLWAPFTAERTPIRYQPGQLIYLQGTQALQFYYILRGTARCFMTSEEGDERTLTLHSAGALIGEAAFFDGEPRISSAVAVTSCTLISIDRLHFTQVIAKHPDLAFSMLHYLARTIRLLSSHVDGSFLSADRRVARHLLSLPAAGNIIHCTHEEMGTSIGASRVTVSRVLSAMEHHGWLKTGYRSVQILNREAIAQFSASTTDKL